MVGAIIILVCGVLCLVMISAVIVGARADKEKLEAVKEYMHEAEASRR